MKAKRKHTPPQLALPAPAERPLIPALTVSHMAMTLAVVAVIGTFAYFIEVTRQITFDASHATTEDRKQVEPFPVGVDPENKQIVEIPNAEGYMRDHAASRSLASERGLVGRAVTALSFSSLFQSLATPSARILIIESGERKEEIAANISKILGWSPSDRALFMKMVSSSTPEMSDGKFYPGTYVVERYATPEKVTPLIAERFETEVLSRYTEDVADVVPLHDALTIASLLEREAGDFEDMRLISGVIWNRLFAGMKLQIDATLQYAKATPQTRRWWPVPIPADKDIDSPFNTYQNDGLPPGPIANPSLGAIIAALNPKNTSCLFYFHDSDGAFHCTNTYEEHVELLKKYYGRGK